MEEKQITFRSGRLSLEGLIGLADAVGARPGAVVCHPHPQYGGSMHNNVVEAILDAMWSLGYATLRFNFRGVGSSRGEYSGGDGEVEDALAAVACLLSRSGVASGGAMLAGYSFGAAVAAKAAADVMQVDRVVAVALPVAMADLSGLATAGKRLWLFSGDRDVYSPADKVAQLASEFGPNARFERIEGADHFFGGFEAALTRALFDSLGQG